MLNLKAGLHAECRPFFDRKGVLVEFLEGAGLAELNDDVGAALDLEAQGEDDDAALVVGIGEGGAGA